MFTIPGEDEWIIIFNKKWDGWGAYKYSQRDDVLRVTVPSSSLDEVVEQFTIEIDDLAFIRNVSRYYSNH